MNRMHTISVAGTVILLLQAGPALADRPSLSGTQAATCAAIDEAGHTYRPVFCDPRCDCLDSLDLSETNSCAEISPGSVSITGSSAPHDAVCAGNCSPNPPGGVCFNDGICLPNENTCSFGNCVDLVAGSCSSDSECDQSSGFTCVGIQCVGASCSAPGVCASNLQIPTFNETFGLSVPGDLVPLACSAAAGNIGSTDSRECIAQIEAAWGQSCTLLCGNSSIEGAEECDDGNTTPGDGCDEFCRNE